MIIENLLKCRQTGPRQTFNHEEQDGRGSNQLPATTVSTFLKAKKPLQIQLSSARKICAKFSPKSTSCHCSYMTNIKKHPVVRRRWRDVWWTDNDDCVTPQKAQSTALKKLWMVRGEQTDWACEAIPSTLSATPCAPALGATPNILRASHDFEILKLVLMTKLTYFFAPPQKREQRKLMPHLFWNPVHASVKETAPS